MVMIRSSVKRTVLASIACLVVCVLSAWVGFSQTPQLGVKLTTDPAIDQVVPFEAEATTVLGSGQFQSPVTLKFQALNSKAEPLRNARIHLQVLTPPPTPGFTTDFPVVEGTKLLDIEQNAPNGELQVQQALPIRGTYRLLVEAVPMIENAFQPIEQTLTLTVPESPLKFRYFGILVIVLLAIGLGGGWVIGGKQETLPGEIAPRRVQLLLSGASLAAIAALLLISVSAELAEAHTAMSPSTVVEAENAVAISQGVKAQLLGDTYATVGEPATFQVQVANAEDDQPIANVELKVTATQLESNWVAFAFIGVTNAAGQLQWQSQFFDGASHQLMVEVLPQPGQGDLAQPFSISQAIDVTGVAPPLSVRLIGLLYFTGLIALGLILGLWLRRTQLQQQAA
jgi:hypothetical protein